MVQLLYEQLGPALLNYVSERERESFTNKAECVTAPCDVSVTIIQPRCSLESLVKSLFNLWKYRQRKSTLKRSQTYSILLLLDILHIAHIASAMQYSPTTHYTVLKPTLVSVSVLKGAPLSEPFHLYLWILMVSYLHFCFYLWRGLLWVLFGFAAQTERDTKSKMMGLSAEWKWTECVLAENKRPL